MFKKIIIAVGLVVTLSGAVFSSNSFPEPYKSDRDIPPGTIVSLVEDDETKVEPSNFDNRSRMFGVTVLNSEGAFIVDPAEDEVLVSSVGPIEVFVTDVNGQISIGDPLTISPVEGIAMFSSKDEPIVGTALETFNDQSPTLGTKEVTTTDGETLVANFGKIRVQIRPDSRNSSIVPPFLESLGEAIAGKPVSSVRLFTGLAIMSVTLASSGALLYGTVKTAIASIGRNPLSKSSVYRGLIQVFAIVLLVFIAGTVGAYLVLTI